MKLELDLLGRSLEAELGLGSARSMWTLGLVGAGAWALTPRGRKTLREAAVKTMAVGMVAGDRVRGVLGRAREAGEELVEDAQGRASTADA